MSEPPKKKGRLTLYEDLLSEETLAERRAKEAAQEAEEAKKKRDASLMFKPTNLGKKAKDVNKVNKPKPTFASMHKLSSSTSTTISAPPTVAASSPEVQQLASTPQQPSQAPEAIAKQSAQKRGFADWLANEDEQWMYDNKSNNARRNKKKKNKQTDEEWSWEDIYDPHAAVNFLEYPKSEVQYDINEAWKQRLYDARRKERQRSGKEESKREEAEPMESSREDLQRPVTAQIAPPTGLSFAPPTMDHGPGPTQPTSGIGITAAPQAPNAQPDPYTARAVSSSSNPPSAPPISMLPGLHPQPPMFSVPAPAPAPLNDDAASKVAAQIAAMKAKALAAKESNTSPPRIDPRYLMTPTPPPLPPPKVSAAPQPGTISASPTFNPEYAAWKARQDNGENEDVAMPIVVDQNAPRSTRPGQSGFAERILKKMGWEEGKGLGASGEGITTAIVAKAEKRKKKSDAQGGGFATPANMGKIVGGKTARSAKDESAGAASDAFGPMSEVIKLEDILSNMDVDKEIQENNILQEIGDEVGEYGKVERLFIWRDGMGGHNEVFVKFTSQLSALRAVKDMDGIEFAGNMVKARFWDAEKFEKGEYE